MTLRGNIDRVMVLYKLLLSLFSPPPSAPQSGATGLSALYTLFFKHLARSVFRRRTNRAVIFFTKYKIFSVPTFRFWFTISATHFKPLQKCRHLFEMVEQFRIFLHIQKLLLLLNILLLPDSQRLRRFALLDLNFCQSCEIALF